LLASKFVSYLVVICLHNDQKNEAVSKPEMEGNSERNIKGIRCLCYISISFYFIGLVSSDSAVCIATGYGMNGRGPEFESQ
jgi:hypothetical protein